MTSRKIAVSLPPQAVERARAAVRAGKARSVNAYVAAALEEKAKLEDLRSMMDEMLTQTGGPLTPAERRAAARAFRRKSPSSKQRRRTETV